MDRISSLPDHILGHILYLLPTKYAVVSSVLSKRWKHLWVSIPALNFDAREHRDYFPTLNVNMNRRSEITFQNFVNRVMLLNDVPYIKKFRLIYECHDRYAPIDTWFSYVISRNLQELELDFCMCVLGKFIDLPSKFYTSNRLVTLKLSRMALNVPSVVSFPFLKILELRRVVYRHNKCVENLLAGCQVLEELDIEEITRHNPMVVQISTHTLRHFTFGYRFCTFEMVDRPYKFIINAPNLEHLHVKGCISDVFEVSNLGSLNTVHVDLRVSAVSNENYTLCHRRILDLFEGIMHAKSITLSSEVLQLLCEGVDRNLPIFPNLKQLAFAIGFNFCWKNVLVDFIKCASKLELVTLNNKQHGWLRNTEDPKETPPQPVPDDLLSYLKTILAHELYANFVPEYVENLVQDINVLKRLKIDCRCPIFLKGQMGLI
ncbi:hypothetical protein RND81_09G006700 [Saponaria officinalis]|uniref:F-box domain-containing protein n=1 Tax=Saponaria officinalis TaxID=3572 RepID=A0AAW1IHA1_SAPOF